MDNWIYMVPIGIVLAVWNLFKIADHLSSINHHLTGYGEFSRVREIQISLENIQKDVRKFREKFPSYLDQWEIEKIEEEE